MAFTFDNNSLSSNQDTVKISFWCRRGLNFKFLIRPSEILPIELTAMGQFQASD